MESDPLTAAPDGHRVSTPPPDHPHEFTRIRTPAGAELLGSCRICGVTAAEVLARIVLERDARLGQVYDLLDAIGAILDRQRRRTTTQTPARRSTCHTRARKAPTTRTARRT